MLGILKVARARAQKGDTIIEVLFAVSVYSAIAVGAIVIMNQGVSTAQASLEINLVRNQIDTQAELLRHLHDGALTSIGRNDSAASTQWDKAVEDSVTQAPSYSDTITTFDECMPASLPPGVFFIDPTTGKVVKGQGNFQAPVTFAQVRLSEVAGVDSKADMIWVQAVHNNNPTGAALDNTSFYDFHIRACWDSPGAKTMMKLGTIVRLYVPKN
jgi:type II secretory pathway pseudopilin PulG